jgi:hypothetical protein
MLIKYNMEEKEMRLIYPAHSKHYFYFTNHVSKFVLEKGHVPLNPFMIHQYFLLDTVKRDLIRDSNNTLVSRSDELWVFGPVSDGVLDEIRLAKKMGKPLKYFEIDNSKDIAEVSKDKVNFEEDLEKFRHEL